MSTYVCAECGGTFTSGRSEEDARAEFAREFPGATFQGAAQLCEDCWQEFQGWRTALSPEQEAQLAAESAAAPNEEAAQRSQR